MKVVGIIEIDGYGLITAINNASADPQATNEKISEQENIPLEQVIEMQVLEFEKYKELFEKNKTFFRLVPGQIYMEDSDAAPLAEKFKELNQNQRLSKSGEVVPCFIGKEYHLKVNGKWEKRKIERVGEAPEGPSPEELTQEQLEEIRAQEEEHRICCMTPEERADAIQRELDALADEAAKLEKRAQIQGNTFNPVAWYQEHAAAVSEKYSVE
jgi:hypothetical protein